MNGRTDLSFNERLPRSPLKEDRFTSVRFYARTFHLPDGPGIFSALPVKPPRFGQIENPMRGWFLSDGHSAYVLKERKKECLRIGV